MNTHMRKSLPCYVFVLSVFGLLLIPSLSETAHAQCAYTVCKSAPGLPEPQSPDEAVFFTINFSQEGGQSGFFELAANAGCGGDAFSGNDFEITEDVPEGWILDSVDCSDSVLVEVTPIENGVSLDCLGGTEITCTFTNIREENIPTLSEWGMIAAAGGFALIGVFFAMRRKRLQASA